MGSVLRLVFVASAVLVESARLTPGERVAASLALAAMIPWYIVLGRPVMRVNDERWVRLAAGWRGPVYLTGMIVLFAGRPARELRCLVPRLRA